MMLRLTENFRIECHDWAQAQHWAEPIRIEVFVKEQGVPSHIEMDSADPDCTHAIAFDRDGHAIGTARLMPDGRIGRMAVLQNRRGQGVGGALLQALLEHATRLGLSRVYLHAQCQACGFYVRHGFRSEGQEYLEADIPHQTMVLELPDIPAGSTE